MREKKTTDEAAGASATRTGKRPEEIYIVEYAISGTARETVRDKLERLMLNGAERLIHEKTA